MNLIKYIKNKMMAKQQTDTVTVKETNLSTFNQKVNGLHQNGYMKASDLQVITESMPDGHQKDTFTQTWIKAPNEKQ